MRVLVRDILLVAGVPAALAWTQLPPNARPRPTWRLAAKPPPSAAFDLKAIEALEAQLDQEDLEAVALEESLAAGTDDEDDDEDTPGPSYHTDVRHFSVDAKVAGKRIDTALAIVFPDLTRSFCGTLVTDQRVTFLANDDDDKSKTSLLDRKSIKLVVGQRITVRVPLLEAVTEIKAQDLPLDILFEDEHMIVLNKAAHMVVHPAAGNWEGTVVNALAYYLQHKSPFGRGDFSPEYGSLTEKNDTDSESDAMVAVEGTDGEPVNFRPGIVHRLDKGTTGVLVVAKTTTALATLSASFKARKVRKTYLAITVGNPGKRVVIDKPIGRHPVHRQRMRVAPNPHKHGYMGAVDKDNSIMATPTSGRRALSFVDTMAFDGRLSLVQVRIETGRTHQIRVHLSDRRTPIYGDEVYGLSDWNKKLREKQKIERPLLHAYKLEIDHPVTCEKLSFEAPLKDDMLLIARNICPDGSGEEETPSFLRYNDVSKA
jgi:23S rRNA pseudouridine1911/1915/1917 synthase